MSALLVLVACSAVWLWHVMFAAPRFPQRAVSSRPTSHPSQGWWGTLARDVVMVVVLLTAGALMAVAR